MTQPTCLTCDKPLRRDNRSGYCAAHHHRKGPPPSERACGCGKMLNYRNTTGRCVKCNIAWLNADPAIRDKRVAGIIASHGSDEVRAKLSKAARKSWLNPEIRAARLAKWNPEPFWRAGVEAARSPEARAKRSVGVSESRMAWCPPEYRDEARNFVRNHHKPLAEVKTIIAERIEQDGLRPLRGHIDAAAEFIARNDRCPVMRLGDDRWRYGTTVKSADDILRMARRKGWQPEGSAL